MQKQVAATEELQAAVTMLRDELAEARQKCTEFELQIHDSENKAEDFERQLTMTKKQKDLLT